MERREFLGVLTGSAVAALPVLARAQAAVPVVGFLRSTRADDLAQSFIAAARAGLNEAGYAEGRNVAFEYRWGDGQRDRLAPLAAELVQKPLTAIIGNGVAALAA